MKAYLEFDLNDIDDRFSHKRAVKADDLMSFIWDFDELLRDYIKYDTTYTAEQLDAIENLKEQFNEMLYDKGINIDELWY